MDGVPFPSSPTTLMRIEPYAGAVVAWAPAKVNLFLEVLGQRPDGYHEIRTLMVAVRLFDTLVFKEDVPGKIQLSCNLPTLATGPDNLVHKAVRLVQQHTGCGRGVQVRLVKRIPMAAGLGGGSADAAATLAALDRLWQLGLKPDELLGLAARLGSDIPFFFSGPAAWCTGRGEQVTPVPLGRPLWFVLLCPKIGLSTAEVYRAVIVPASPQSGAALRQAVAAGAVADIGRLLFNRLQPAAQTLCPAIAGYQRRLAELQPAGQLMSGSGSSLFALCHDRSEALCLARALRRGPQNEGFSVCVVGSCS